MWVDKSHRLARWAEFLAGFYISWRYGPGAANHEADALFRPLEATPFPRPLVFPTLRPSAWAAALRVQVLVDEVPSADSPVPPPQVVFISHI